MSQDSGQELDLLFRALDVPTAERVDFLRRECPEDAALAQRVFAMLASQDTASLIDQPLFDIHQEEPLPVEKIGSYRLLKRLGRGGMGSVFLAEREDFAQRVALKVIRRGLDLDAGLVRRFHNERQILARLQHKNIAQVFDGGTVSDRLPYFVMEYVEGEPINAYCLRQRLGIPERLELFRQVCDAVGYAHQNLVVHRDLKPSNILITASGEPKLLDFGVAKLLDESVANTPLATVTGQAPMTPRYASPEQIKGESITTVADVYSLGVLLYELLTGLSPYRVDTDIEHDLARAVCEQEPDRPSTAARRRSNEHTLVIADRLDRKLSGDLDAIVLKAIRKEPEQRYGSVEQLAEDIGRYLEGMPVEARAGTWAYRATRFSRRHRIGLATALAFVILSISYGLHANYLARQSEEQKEIAEKQKEIAEKQKENAERTLEFLKSLFLEASPDAVAISKLSAIDLLRRGKDRVLNQELASHQSREVIAGDLGSLFRELGYYDDSQQLMQRALELALDNHPSPHQDIARRLNNLAVVYHEFDKYDDAAKRFREVLQMKEVLKQTAQQIFKAKSNLASALMHAGHPRQAEILFEEVLVGRRALYKNSETDLNLASSYQNSAANQLQLGNLDRALERSQRALSARRKSKKPTFVADSLHLIGKIWLEKGDSSQARISFSESFSIRDIHLKSDHRKISLSKRFLSESLLETDLDTAEVRLDQAIAALSKSPDPGWRMADFLSVKGELRSRQGDPEEAAILLQQSYDRLREIRGPQVWVTRRAKARLQEFLQAGPSDQMPLYQAEVSTRSP